ncbi:DUF4271 domain-containing protein [Panacibacter ginsenosidivorans]|uniref:DUF4271 domain-containing protein n=1 Tax=Panacibacter ginsenosidivorans TaxID=1813871 RepID=A0A5B8V9E9_9BACT|nr:DUF4271 domain-containing protein [Panacibacter ginsenosidivorans]QEC67952.1 DUF4271 domain-containing protein [Panacibacter ginsenosidivorans]
MKPILSIVLSLLFFQGFAQDDSMLQRLLDSAKTAPAIQSPAIVKKDTTKHNNTPVIKKDSVKTVSIQTDSLFADDSLLKGLSDSLTVDSAAIAIPAEIKKPLSWLQDTAFMNLLKIPYIKKKIQPVLHDGDLRMPLNNDYLFYALAGIILLVAIIKQLFPKYFANLFRLLFEASFRQKQRREQLMQETLPSLLMNILFILVGGLFIALLSNYYGWLRTGFWWLVLYSITILALVYMFKYIVIQFTGWVFNARESASTYSFIVFLINKMIGVLLLPMLLLLAFSSGEVWDITVTIAAGVVILLLIFRYIISLRIIRGALNINPLHFFIYLCAVELMPMLIIYKVLFNLTGKSN